MFANDELMIQNMQAQNLVNSIVVLMQTKVKVSKNAAGTEVPKINTFILIPEQLVKFWWPKQYQRLVELKESDELFKLGTQPKERFKFRNMKEMNEYTRALPVEQLVADDWVYNYIQDVQISKLMLNPYPIDKASESKKSVENIIHRIPKENIQYLFSGQVTIKQDEDEIIRVTLYNEQIEALLGISCEEYQKMSEENWQKLESDVLRSSYNLYIEMTKHYYRKNQFEYVIRYVEKISNKNNSQ